MSPLERQLHEDKAMRDAALGVFKADIALVRGDLRQRGVGARLKDRVGDGTMEMVDEAAEFAQSNTGIVAAGLGAVVLWFARGPILDGLGHLVGSGDDDRDESDERQDAEPDEPHRRSRSN